MKASEPSTTWGVGDYELMAERLLPAAAELVDVAAVNPRDRVLDIACGSVNGALIAAGRADKVVALAEPGLLRSPQREASQRDRPWTGFVPTRYRRSCGRRRRAALDPLAGATRRRPRSSWPPWIEVRVASPQGRRFATCALGAPWRLITSAGVPLTTPFPRPTSRR